jgi:threonine/homoserine/homoserine lactone efflux protein
LSIFPKFVSQEAVLIENIFLVDSQAFVFVFIIFVLVWFLDVILLARSFMKFLTNTKNFRWLNVLSGTIFIAIGAKLASTKL